MEDFPAYSRFLQSLTHLLSEVECGKVLISSFDVAVGSLDMVERVSSLGAGIKVDSSEIVPYVDIDIESRDRRPIDGELTVGVSIPPLIRPEEFEEEEKEEMGDDAPVEVGLKVDKAVRDDNPNDRKNVDNKHFGERPVIHFDKKHSSLNLSPQKDLQVCFIYI